MAGKIKGCKAPHPDSLRKRLIDFFEANPDEELMVQDISVKFNVSNGVVRNSLYQMRHLNEIWSGFVVRKGSKL